MTRELSEIKAMDVFENRTDPIMVLSPDGIILYINHAFVEKFEKLAKDAIGKHFLESGIVQGLSNEEKEQAKQRFNNAIEKRILPRTEYRFENKDYGPVYYHTNTSIIENSDGEVEFAIMAMKDVTQQVAIQQSLKQHQEELRIILDTTPAGIWYKDDKNNILRVNKSGAASVGLTPADIEGKASVELFPEHAEKYFQDDLEVLESGEPKLGIIEPLITADGDTLWVKTDKIPTRDVSGKVNGLVAIAEDFTESKLKSELFTRLSLSSSLIDSAELVLKTAIQIEGIDSGGVYSRDKEDGALTLLNHAGLSDDFVKMIIELGPETPQAQLVSLGNAVYAPFETVLGVDDPQMREGLKSIAIIPIKHEEEVLAVLNLASHSHPEIPESSRNFIESLALQLGEIFKRVIASSALALSEQNLQQLNLELEDRVVARTRELESARDKAQTYLELAEVVMIALDKDGLVTLVNRKGCEVLGCNSEEIIGKNWFETFIPPESKEKVYGLFCEIRSGRVEAIKNSENPVRTAQGKRKLIAWNNTILYDTDGRIIGTLSSGEDITERKLAEDALRESEQRNRIIADGMSDLILIYDKDVRLREYFTSDESLLYLPWDKMDGKRVEEFMPSKSTDSHYKNVQQVRETDENVIFEYELEIGSTLKWFRGTMMLHEDKESIVVAVKDITERKEAEEKLRESEERYRELYEEVRIGLLTTNVSDGKIKECNKRLVEMFGFKSREQALAEGMAPERYVNPGQRQQIISELKERGYYEGEIALTKVDGTPIWVSVSTRLDIEEGTIESAFTDITERKRDREQIADAERRLRLSYDQAAIGMVWVNIDGKFLRVNEAFTELVGYSEEELFEMTFNDVTHPEDYEIGSAIIKRLESGKTERGSIEKRYIHKNGNVIHVRLNTAFIKNDVEGRGYFFTQAEDITENIMATWALEERMKETSCLYAIAELATQRGINSVELLGQAVHVIPSGWQYTEHTCARIQFEDFETTTSNFKVTKWKHSAEICIFGEPSGFIEVYYLEEKPLVNEGPFLKEEKELIDAIAARLATSIERNRAETKLQALNEELESIVDERTKALRDTQEELVKKERLATLGQISGGVGHELRNPLGAIKNAAYFLKMMLDTQNSEIDETLEILDKEVENCERIISSLLDFARPKTPVLQKIVINELILGVLEQIDIPADITVKNQHSDKLPFMLGDPHQFERILINLITNAIQAMVDGGTLTLRTESDGAGNVLISIKDTGTGISEENMSKLYEPLFTTKAKGIGLGLCIVKSLVENHKGEISAESKFGKGTTFKIKIPTIEAEVH